MQETQLAKPVLVKPIEGMNQFIESLSLKDSEFRYLQGVFPKEAGIQARFPGKVAAQKFGSSVISIGDFLGRRVIQTTANGVYYEQEDGTFATLQNAAATASINRDSYAVSAKVRLMVKANGFERTKVVDEFGNIYNAELPPPITTPTCAALAGGNLPYSRWFCYKYVYAASVAYPNIERSISINGQICPRSNPSPRSNAYNTPAAGANRSVTVTCGAALPVGRPDIDEIWVFRTAAYTTQAEAENAADAGLLYFKGKTTGFTYQDITAIDGVDQIEQDNFGASSFSFVIYYEPYWIGFGAPRNVKAVVNTVSAGGTISWVSGDTFYPGMEGRRFKVTNINTGGIDGKGTYIFHYVSATLGQAYNFAGATSITTTSGNTITIQSPSTTIYRSKAYDPFSWGWTRVIGNENEALEFALKVGGGIGTAIGTIPNETILKVDAEFPTRSYGFNLQVLDDFDQFKQTQKSLSETFSVSCHGSQFAAQTQDGNSVLWGMDYKSFAIVQSNGVSQNRISTPIQQVLRQLTVNKADQLMCHGIYDPFTQCNCIWLTSSAAPSRVHLMVYQHAPTGFWGVVEDLDILCSASVQDLVTGQPKIMVGTETGLYGQAFVNGTYQNWTPSGNVLTANITGSTSTTITAPAASFTVSTGLVGSWVLLTDVNDQNEQWARISAATTTQLTFDRVVINGVQFATLQTTPTKYYLGLIECRALKYFDFKTPNSDKRILELWLSQENTGSAQPTLVRTYREWLTTLWLQVKPTRDSYRDGTVSTSFVEKKMPSDAVKSVAIELINREYTQWTLRNMVLKAQVL